MVSDVQRNIASRDPRDIARAELARWRHRLASLTHEQEVRIETLVISTATKISLLGGQAMEWIVLEPAVEKLIEPWGQVIEFERRAVSSAR